MAPSTPARRPFQISISRSRGRTNSTKRSFACAGLMTATASGSAKPVRKKKLLACRNDGEAVAERGGEALAALEEGREVGTHAPLIPYPTSDDPPQRARSIAR